MIKHFFKTSNARRAVILLLLFFMSSTGYFFFTGISRVENSNDVVYDGIVKKSKKGVIMEKSNFAFGGIEKKDVVFVYVEKDGLTKRLVFRENYSDYWDKILTHVTNGKEVKYTFWHKSDAPASLEVNSKSILPKSYLVDNQNELNRLTGITFLISTMLLIYLIIRFRKIKEVIR